MKVNELSVEQLKALIQDTIEATLREYLGDSDEGLELKEEVIQRLKARKAFKRPKIPMEQVAGRLPNAAG
ncbi:MAG: hypothetical protein HY530_05475 [Chloroflexi bacterium]|nr:hypothetical protein [Chloroflexota bacterium]